MKRTSKLFSIEFTPKSKNRYSKDLIPSIEGNTLYSKLLFALFPLLALLLLNSCQSSTNSNAFSINISGNLNDVVVVMTTGKWESKAGEVMREVLSEPVSGLPQEEPMFDIVNIPHEALGQVFKQQRNIIVTKIGPNYREKKITIQPDLWARTQMVMSITAPSDTAFADLIRKNKAQICNTFNEAELKRLMEGFKKAKDLSVVEKLEKNHQVLLNIPLGYKLTHDTTNFIRFTHEYPDVSKGALVTMVLCVYHYPYEDSATFTKTFLLEKHEAMMREFVPGEVAGSYVTTEMRAPVEFREYKLGNTTYTAELKGLWRMKNGMAMGGPFINISQYDEARKRIVSIEGFIFAPGMNKRNLMKQMEAIVYSVRYPSVEKPVAYN